MATITKKYAATARQFGGVPYGNATSLQFTFETNGSGVFVDSDDTTAVVQGDIVRLGVLPAGMRLDDALAIVSDPFSTSVTHKIGFAYVDSTAGADITAVPADDDYFYAALAVTAGRTRANNTGVTPIVLPRDAYLTMEVNGSTADHATSGRMDIIVQGVLTGNP